MRFLCPNLRHALLLLLALVALGVSACSTAEPENVSSRPWNSPRGWEGGGMLPSSINEGR
jgi:hypothetical protein